MEQAAGWQLCDQRMQGYHCPDMSHAVLSSHGNHCSLSFCSEQYSMDYFGFTVLQFLQFYSFYSYFGFTVFSSVL